MSQSYRITEISINGSLVIGIAACPGQKNSLESDLKAMEDWGAEILISLVETHEFSSLGVPDFEVSVRVRDLDWYHLPIADMSVPGKEFFNLWHAHGPDILRIIERGGRIVVHCAGGLGRSGMIAAKLMTAFDVPPDEAIAKVREARHGAIETEKQENYVLKGPALIIARDC